MSEMHERGTVPEVQADTEVHKSNSHDQPSPARVNTCYGKGYLTDDEDIIQMLSSII